MSLSSSSPPPSPPPPPPPSPSTSSSASTSTSKVTKKSFSMSIETSPFIKLSPSTIIPTKIIDLVNGYCTFCFEKQYNVFKSLKFPYCTLCIMFNNKNLTFNSDWKILASISVMQPLSKLCQLSHALFRYAAHGGSECLKADTLIRCKNCDLTVHKLCYDISETNIGPRWLCDRCKKNILLTNCEYCPLKGGVLKETERFEWAHPECNLLVRSRNTLDTSTTSLNTGEPNKTCVVCNLSSGQCFRCSEYRCDVWFHVSCGIFAGFNFRIDSYNEKNILTRCNAHNN